jgi:hypothetical protein
VTISRGPGSPSSRRRQGTRFAFAPARNVSFAAGVTALTAVFVGALWLQWYLGFPWFFRILTGLVDLLLVYIVIDLWLGRHRRRRGNGTLRVRHTVLGAGRSRTLAAAEIASIDLHINMQTQGRYGTPYYEVRAGSRTAAGCRWETASATSGTPSGWPRRCARRLD